MKIERENSGGAGTALTYFILRLCVIVIMILGIINARWHEVFYCVLTLILFMIPSIVERKLKLELPSALEIIVLLFIFAAEILGEIGAFYLKVQSWDLILHTTNGFLMAAIGFALIDVLNRSPKINMSMSPFFVAFVAFCFSMTIGVLWEFTEYSADTFLGADMQKDTIVEHIASVDLNPDKVNKAIQVDDITQSVIYGKINGEEKEIILPGYMDIGLHDTMEDMFVNLIGAVVFSIIGGIYIKGRGKGGGQVAEKFIPRLLTDEEAEEAEEDRKRRWKRRYHYKSDLPNVAKNVPPITDDKHGKGE
ncbi:MAG: hypothetical protein RSE64_02170 [Oscillospiraceae bacterium]